LISLIKSHVTSNLKLGLLRHKILFKLVYTSSISSIHLTHTKDILLSVTSDYRPPTLPLGLTYIENPLLWHWVHMLKISLG
jgi:hypothetical protein